MNADKKLRRRASICVHLRLIAVGVSARDNPDANQAIPYSHRMPRRAMSAPAQLRPIAQFAASFGSKAIGVLVGDSEALCSLFYAHFEVVMLTPPKASPTRAWR